MIELLNERKKTDVKKLENQLKIYEDSFESLQKEIAKEAKIKKYLESESTCNKFDFKSMITSNNWKAQLNETGDDHEIGKRALVKKDGKPVIFEWNGKDWIETEEVPKYKMVRTLCEFKNLDFADIDFNQLDCLFKQQYGCHSVKYYYFEERKEELEKRINDYKKLIESIKNNDKSKFYDKNLKNLISLFEIEKTNVQENNELNTVNNEEVLNINMNKIIMKMLIKLKKNKHKVQQFKILKK